MLICMVLRRFISFFGQKPITYIVVCQKRFISLSGASSFRNAVLYKGFKSIHGQSGLRMLKFQ